ncbi:MAG: hypothetical protein ACYS8Z_11080 [Planctomycetota bacterium]|jgi:hypothetical protein
MVAGKTEGTMKIERIGRTWVGELVDRMGVFLRIVAPGFLGIYIWRAAIEEGDYNLTWLSAAAAGALGFLTYALHTCFLSRLILRPLTMLSLLALETHHWISNEQRKLAKQGGAKVLLLELASQRWRRRIADSPEVKAVQKGLDRRCRLGSLMYCSSYAILFAGILALYSVGSVEELWLAPCMTGLGGALLVASFISGYFTMQTDLWAAKTYPQGKMPKLKKVTVKASKLKVKKRTAKKTKKKTR